MCVSKTRLLLAVSIRVPSIVGCCASVDWSCGVDRRLLLLVLFARPVDYGGAGGGIKFVWRGILFKLADGSKGPYYGNDEAAAKGAYIYSVAFAEMTEANGFSGAKDQRSTCRGQRLTESLRIS